MYTLVYTPVVSYIIPSQSKKSQKVKLNVDNELELIVRSSVTVLSQLLISV